MGRMDPAYHVDVFTDPGLCSAIFSRLQHRHGGDGFGDYQLVRRDRTIPLRPDNSLDVDAVRAWSREGEADFQVVITEIPRRAGKLPKMAELHFEDGLVIISLPALGWRGLTTKLERAIFDCLDTLAHQDLPDVQDRRVRFGVVHEQDVDTGRSVFIASPWWWPGRIRLVLGMVRTNQPFQDVTKLKRMWAAASATGAFGVFYSSIWQMSLALPSWRLALISLLAVGAMVGWLMFSNRLWDPPRRLGSRVEAAMYNASTIATLLVTVLTFYTVLMAGILVAALVVIEVGYMQSVIGVSPSLSNYVDIAWLSASLGTIAGALGSNFDSHADIERLTHGQRNAERVEKDDDH